MPTERATPQRSLGALDARAQTRVVAPRARARAADAQQSHVMRKRHAAQWRRFPSGAGEESTTAIMNQAAANERDSARRMRDVSEFESCAVRFARAARAHMHDRV